MNAARTQGLLGVRGFGVLSLDRDGSIVDCNEKAAEILGATVVEVAGRPVTDFLELSADGTPIAAESSPFSVASRSRQAFDAGVLVASQRDGSHRRLRIEALPLLDEAHRVEGVLLTLTDVTSSHGYEDTIRVERRRLAQAGDRFRRVLESVPDAIAVCHENRLGYANAALVVLLGHASVTDLVGKDVTRVLPGHMPLERPANGARPPLREESWRRVDGTTAVVEVAEHGIDLDGSVGTLLIARDITERKRVQLELVQSTRLASVGTLAAGVAHEINNPLTYVIANLDLVKEDLQRLGNVIPAGRLSNLLEMTEDACAGAERVRKIVRGLKAFSRTDDECRIPLDVAAVMNVAIEMTHNEIRHRACLVREYGAAPRVEADEGRLGQVFVNLLVNAAQAIPEGNVDANEIRVVTRSDATGRAVIEVRDTGDGIAPEVLGRIFDPFFTTKPIGVGTGLGLSICHGLVTELGGELQVESAVGRGTVFRVMLPASAQDLPVTAAPAVIDARPSERRARVLVVDDDPTVARVVERVLEREHDVVVVHDGQSALERIVAGQRFDVILCDLMMPEMTGMAFHAELAARAPTVCDRVVFITGGAFSAGADAFLERVPNMRVDKPFDHAALRAIIRGYVPEAA